MGNIPNEDYIQAKRLEQLNKIRKNTVQTEENPGMITYNVNLREKKQPKKEVNKIAILGIAVLIVGGILIAKDLPNALEKEALHNQEKTRPYIEAMQEKEALEEIEKITNQESLQDDKLIEAMDEYNKKQEETSGRSY